MKKLILLVVLVASATMASACDGTCQCGGALPVTVNDGVTTSIKVVGYFAAGTIIAVSGGVPCVMVLPELCIKLSESQRAYNLKHGIKHSRELRKEMGKR